MKPPEDFYITEKEITVRLPNSFQDIYTGEIRIDHELIIRRDFLSIPAEVTTEDKE